MSLSKQCVKTIFFMGISIQMIQTTIPHQMILKHNWHWVTNSTKEKLRKAAKHNWINIPMFTISDQYKPFIWLLLSWCRCYHSVCTITLFFQPPKSHFSLMILIFMHAVSPEKHHVVIQIEYSSTLHSIFCRRWFNEIQILSLSSRIWIDRVVSRTHKILTCQ